MNTNIKAYDPGRWDVPVPKFRTTARAKTWMKKHGWGRLPPQIEEVFLKNAEDCKLYATAIGSRLPKKYEDFIMNHSAELAIDYMESVVKGPLPEYEHIIKNKPADLVEYARRILGSRLPSHLEDCLIGDPSSVFRYSYEILDGRLPELLHNYMLSASLDANFEGEYFGWTERLPEFEEFNAERMGPKQYFDFLKYQNRKLHRVLSHHVSFNEENSSISLSDFLKKLKDDI